MLYIYRRDSVRQRRRKRLCRVSTGYRSLEPADWSFSKLFRQVVISGKKSSKSSIIKADSSLKNTKLTSLLLRINEPYWLIHHGNCEHFLVVDQIRYDYSRWLDSSLNIHVRLAHPSDPRSSCPLTLHITPPLLDLCRACTKIPASWSVVGDSRLGESPCVLCGPCWRNMGESEEDGVTVLPLPGYSFSSESLQRRSNERFVKSSSFCMNNLKKTKTGT